MDNVVEFTRLLSEAWGKFGEAVYLLPIPIILSLVDYGKVKQVMTFEGIHFGVRFPLPEPTPTLWSFVSLPPAPHNTPLSAQGAVITAILILVGSYLSAGYVGSLRNIVLGNKANFFDSAERDFLGFLQFNLLIYGFVLLLVLVAMASPPSVLLAIPVLLVFLYMVYGTPFLISVLSLSFWEAFNMSIKLAGSGGEYLDYALKYLLFGVLVSIPLTFVVVDVRVMGVLFGLLIAALLSVTLTTATVMFFTEFGRIETSGT
ncbi:hypothetical protein [Thermococcus sp.]